MPLLFVCRSDRRSGVNAIAVVLTNGDSQSQNDTLREASLLRQAGVTVITVAAGSWINQYVISAMTSYPYQSNTITAPDYTSLASSNQSYIGQLANAICNSQYIVITLLYLEYYGKPQLGYSACLSNPHPVF